MSRNTLPLLFINLGGEMMYILDQRLKAQNIPQDKSQKVLNDIVGTMLNKKFMDELFKPQELYNKKALRTMFDKLAHASIMRLNTASMDKLYDLMTMALKYQMYTCSRPRDILLVTLNHLDAINSYVNNPAIVKQVEMAYTHLMQSYGSMMEGELQDIRYTILNFFQDMHIRVSVFLKDKVQNPNGRFVLSTSGPISQVCEIPGIIRYFDSAGEVSCTKNFHPGGEYRPAVKLGSLELHGDRVIKLGLNIYTAQHTDEKNCQQEDTLSTEGDHLQHYSTQMKDAQSSGCAKEELNMLAQLIGGGSEKKTREFRLSLFNTDREEEEFAQQRLSSVAAQNVISINAKMQPCSADLEKIIGEMTVTESPGTKEKGQELLDLMDSME